MDSIDVSKGRSMVLQDAVVLETLPPELLEVIRSGPSSKLLDAIAVAALEPKLTTRFFARFENVFADTCARWMQLQEQSENKNDTRILEAFARILPFAPHLTVYLENAFPSSKEVSSPQLQWGKQDTQKTGRNEIRYSDLEIQRKLLAFFRLLNFNKPTFAQRLSATIVQGYLTHENMSVRYLAIRSLCQILSASDYKLEEMIAEFIRDQQPVMGDFDGKLIDYAFLSLYERKRMEDIYKLRQDFMHSTLNSTAFHVSRLSEFVAPFGSVLLPRPDGPPTGSSNLVPTSTTSENMHTLAKALLLSSPILLHGLSGSGKTSLVNDFARELKKDLKMVTLHLNEQTDAKMLIGMYSTDSRPGSFTWRPGILTTAVKEGRWVFIEDLDRAPNEVISVILPLIERGELVIPSRAETIRAGRGFRLIASIRTSLTMGGDEISPPMHMLGARLWNRVPVKMPSRDEFGEIISGLYPILHKFLPGIIQVFDRLYTLFQNPTFASRNRTSLGRPISPRDLLKWCRRLHAILMSAGSITGEEPITEGTKNEMFMEAADCFASSLQTEDSRTAVISCIAEEMHIPPQRLDHYLTAHVPLYEDNFAELQIGRVRLAKRITSSRIAKGKKSRPFANTVQTRRLLEQVGVALKMTEPVLLVGETGIGKTTVVQQLADSLGFKLTAVNLSQQSEVGDLLGGFKPVNVRSLATPLREEFDELFVATGISTTRNQRYLEQLSKAFAKSQWNRVSKLWREAPRMFAHILSDVRKLNNDAAEDRKNTQNPAKRRKTESKLDLLLDLEPRWQRFSESLDQFDVQLSGGSTGFAFSFVEGNIVRAARNGEWVLLDEINLASPDTLESIADLIQSGSSVSRSIILSETGRIERVQAHPDFRIFAAMNPATDVGKRDLPAGLRSRFTEIYVESPDRNLDDLLAIIKAYLKRSSSNDERAAHDVARLYLNTKRLADDKHLVDGANQVPHFSLRTLTRVLSYVTEIAASYGLRRSLYEGFAMGFLTLLNSESERMLMPLINHHLLESHGNPQALLAQVPRHPEDGREYVKFINKRRDRQYWMLQGRETPQEQPHYIITPFVERNLLNLVRATSTRRFPVLVQGPTSSGKTSMIEYLAKFSGNKFVRINNHEHTDLQEYLGTYVSGRDGQLRFQDGLLVQALREGHWIVLDELNLAPTDVLEALNRLLDDNRELLIPETQEVVRPHENFMLFATQNPPGLYGGRKTLSRAFRNRFLELHFDDIPEDELEYILEHRSQKTAPSDCKRIVKVYKELSRLRQSNRLFEQKDSFATLRDLFRWALRDADNREQLAANGYMLLGERVRKAEERAAVKELIERIMKVQIDPNILYDIKSSPEIQIYSQKTNTQGVVWTGAMRRLFILVCQALKNNEPVLLVGETGCGKTTVCQMLAEAFGKELHIVNAHQNTETGDLIGAQRPVRNRATISKQLEKDLREVMIHLDLEVSGGHNSLEAMLTAFNSLDLANSSVSIPVELSQRIEAAKLKIKTLFEWCDGSLVQAMKRGQFFLLDEISLADDSVLERLNSVLESHRTLLLAEKGADDSFVQATDGFQFFATMNPGGDYGKRELSPALRNRFTEIWVPPLSELDDVLQIVTVKLKGEAKQFAGAIVAFAEWFGQTYQSTSSQSISVRDILAWISFINGFESSDPYFNIVHGAAMVYVDTLGANPAALLAINPENISEERLKCLRKLSMFLQYDVTPIYAAPLKVTSVESEMRFGDFSIPKTRLPTSDVGFAFHAPTTALNAMRVVRALQVQKPILVEGSPGVGKTTLIIALARAVGKEVTRINLSEQTDLMDLFGSDVPVDGAEAGNFAWRDAPFLQAMQKGDWVLLDEMNLASQSVLEGLNACLDHRGEVYISELDQTFKRHPGFTVFAAQNPHHQGGGRKGLPSSFVNRFTVVYADVFRNDDLMMICKHNFPSTDQTLMTNVIKFVSALEEAVVYRRKFGSEGSPWEFNLRDTLRWLQLLTSKDPLLAAGSPADFLNLIFRQRFRTSKDREYVDKMFAEVFGASVPFRQLFPNLNRAGYQVGQAYLPRNSLIQRLPFPYPSIVPRLSELESILICVQQNLPCIVVGPSGSGKSSLIQHVAAGAGADLVVFPLNSEIDTMDLVGGFEQVDPQRESASFIQRLSLFLENHILATICDSTLSSEAFLLLRLCQNPELDSREYFRSIKEALINLKQTSVPHELDELVKMSQIFTDQPKTIEAARFEWVDGVLIKALEKGQWLVLDNANLCSSSVLDRLNSLLEPNGYLSINEHCDSSGEPKIVRPHPDFRLFSTMDPRYGELSRAMRNRTIEIFMDMLTPFKDSQVASQSITIESSQVRFSNVVSALELHKSDSSDPGLLTSVALDNLSYTDELLLPRFIKAVQNDLMSSDISGLRVLQAMYRHVENGKERYQLEGLYDDLAKAMDLPIGFMGAQTVQVLSNSPLVPLLQKLSAGDQVYWFGTLFELNLEVLKAKQEIEAQESAMVALRPSQMNRLQRSMVRDRVLSVAKDSTAGVAGFLGDILEALQAHFGDYREGTSNWRAHNRAILRIVRFWWETLRIVVCEAFDEAAFQAHLTISQSLFKMLMPSFPRLTRDMIGKPGSSVPVIEIIQRKLDESFNSGFKLTTGLSMELLWKRFMPSPIPNWDTLTCLVEMEASAARFDSLRWKVSVSASELARVMSALMKAYQLVLKSGVDARSLAKSLSSELDRLESNISDHPVDNFPFMQHQFEVLRQYRTLEIMRKGSLYENSFADVMNLEIAILSNSSTTSLLGLATSSQASQRLQSINYMCSNGEVIGIIEKSFSISLLQRLQRVGDVDLKSLKLFETELPLLGLQAVQVTESLCRDPFLDMNAVLLELIEDVVDAHPCETVSYFQETLRDVCKLSFKKWASISTNAAENGVHPSENLHYPHLDHLMAALIAIDTAADQPVNRLKHSAMAWIEFAIGGIALYVPNRSFDPDIKQRMERDQHARIRKSLEDKLYSLREFEIILTGQNSNLRCQLLEEDIADLGEVTENFQQIVRPEISELEQLQGEFNNLLGTVFHAQPQKLVQSMFDVDFDGSSPMQLKVFQNNVSQIIRRLSERFRAYTDITVPLTSILRCLQIGMSITMIALAEQSAESAHGLSLSQITPFLGGSPGCNDSVAADQPLEILEKLATASAVEGVAAFDEDRRTLLFRVFHSCYEQWSKRLDADRAEAEANSGIYRFRGSVEDEEEVDQDQFNELFPSYEEASRPVNGVINHSGRDIAIQLTTVHRQIFSPSLPPSQSIISLTRTMASRIGTMNDNDQGFIARDMNGLFLPGALLLLNDRIDSLSSKSVTTDLYNFYVDKNLPEARKLVELIHQIQNRFKELQAVDEIGHMQPLEDVLVSCKELLEFRHIEPLAKIITKVEKVHGFMHEWQFGGWASRVNSALSLYDRLTATIISWRRLELSTWSRLFEMEYKKCEEDAKSWYFIAYRVVIAVPLSLSHSESELQAYVPKLLQEMWMYFETAIQGQFSQRLQLLKQLQKHLELLTLDFPPIFIVARAVSNFFDFVIRFERQVVENLRSGRQALEKAMKEVLLLASWKDTNIVALRDSARRSHHKLFKIVRKYRALLGQPMEHILKQRLPDEPDQSAVTSTSAFKQQVQTPRGDPTALAHCEANIPQWSQRAKRLINIPKTVELMAITSQKPPDAFNGSYYIESFLSHIIETISELQKATPTVLTEENTPTVKYLKSRKRNLFAEILKGLRKMGIQQNLGTEILARQESLSVVLSVARSLPVVEEINCAGVEYYFHKTLDLIPRARLASRQHSEDLSAAEVARSTGLLEGLLQLLLQQRDSFARLASNSVSLDKVIRQSQALWAPGEYNIFIKNIRSTTFTTLKWLPNIIRVGIELLKVHEKLQKRDNPEVHKFFSAWVENFDELGRQAAILPDLPEFITSSTRNKWESGSQNRFEEFQSELGQLTKVHPDLNYIFQQILPWVASSSAPIPLVEKKESISELDQKLSKVSDSILVTIEKFGETIASFPSSAEDPVWLVKTEACIIKCLSSLNSSTIIMQINEAFALLRAIITADKDNGETAGALFAVALPIFQQYSKILRRTLAEFADLHRSTCKMAYVLTKTFTQIAAEGFCTPSEKSDSQDGKTENLESGTGLGDGEGVEDISKDIQDDEDLSELAQEKNKGETDEIQDEKDAVDMADADMEGEMGDSEEKENDESGSGDDDEEGNEMEDEAGDVDDLDPNAVDEKMWDGDGEKAEKDQKGNQSKGKENEDESIAAQEDGKPEEGYDEGDEEQEFGAEENEEIQLDDGERHDPQVEESEALELPEHMDLDGSEEDDNISQSDRGIDGLSDVNDDDTEQQEDVDENGGSNLDGQSTDGKEDQDMGSDLDVVDLDEKDQIGDGKDTEEAGEKAEEEETDDTDNQDVLLHENTDEVNSSLDNLQPSDVRGSGENQGDDKIEDSHDAANKAERNEGDGGNSSEQQESVAEDGQKGRQAGGEAPQTEQDETQPSMEAQPFKRLGDALEKWHRQQTTIKDATEQDDRRLDQPREIDGKVNEFQHVQDEDAEADTQALGTATDDQAHVVDETMAIDTESNEFPDIFQPDELDEEHSDEIDNMDIEDSIEPRELNPSEAYEGRAGAIIQKANANHADSNETRIQRSDGDDDVEEVDNQLLSTHLDELNVMTSTKADARHIWANYESRTRDLSHSLTSQLRLILAPTLATKMRGDFRTGKRLNIKRIIPYIASQYKRDKIWMRRSIPSKRSYQILLAVDDSQSMAKSGASALALETLVMISKSLALLEVGEISVLGFGESVHVSHAFSTPFSAEAGPKILQSFNFAQRRTDVTKLVRTSIELFRIARQRASSSPADLWQLELIISDGVCDSSEHEPIRRLLREAIAERIMMVFVIVDDIKTKKEGESVLDLKEAKFVKDEITGGQKVRIERYLDTFPFSYYLVVGDVRELPGVLAALLRQWFAEVVDAEG